MGTFIGPIGGLIPVRVSQTSVTGGVTYASSNSLTGRRVNVQAQAIRRTWAVDSSLLEPQDAAVLDAHASGGFGPGPFVWVPADAPGANLLSPWDCVMGANLPWAPAAPAGWTQGGASALPDGTLSAGTLIRAGSTDIIQPHTAFIPAPPNGGPITFSAWVNGGGSLSAKAVTAGGGDVSAWFNTNTAPAGGGWVTVTVASDPSWVAFKMVGNTTVTQLSAACATWTAERFPYTVGRGCNSAVVDQVSSNVVLAVVNSPLGGRLGTSSFTVAEVG